MACFLIVSSKKTLSKDFPPKHKRDNKECNENKELHQPAKSHNKKSSTCKLHDKMDGYTINFYSRYRYVQQCSVAHVAMSETA